MHDILKEIVSSRIMRIEAIKAGYSPEERLEIHKQAKLKKRRIRQTFKDALMRSKSERAVIAEFKRASPSKGDINVTADPARQVIRYEKNGASAVSVLTEPEYFKGSLRDLQAVTSETTLPVLCKDFIVDPIQIDFAKLSGADAVLLIAAILDQETLIAYYQYARSLGLDVLVESHNQIEVMKALKLKSAIIGFNNRNLKTFETDISVTERLMALIPKGRLIVSESGIKSVADMERLKRAGAHAFLVGETLMQHESDAFVKEFTGCPPVPKIKICGLTRQSDIRIANLLQVDYAGFVFAKSKREVDTEKAARLIKNLDPSIRSVGVFVDRSKDDVQRIAEVCGLDVIQLHGSEDTEVYQMDRQVWKSVSVKPGQAASINQDIQAAGIVFDTFSPDMAGGTGKVFDWNEPLPADEMIRVAAGGLKADNVKRCTRILAPDVLDISSGVETDGFKDPEKMRQFVSTVRCL